MGQKCKGGGGGGGGGIQPCLGMGAEEEATIEHIRVGSEMQASMHIHNATLW